MAIRLAVDTGGTFTDIIAIDESTGNLTALKTPSTPEDPSIALLNSVEKALIETEQKPSDVNIMLHGSTVATNAVLEHKFDGLGLLVTKGFRHMIEIARQSVPDGYGNSFFWVKPPRLVPLHMVREIEGRILFNGEEVAKVDVEQTLAAVKELVEDGAKCIAICLLHSYANAHHEKIVAEIVKKNFPNLFVSLSSEVLPEYREYERAMTTLIDVLVKPFCQTYLKAAADKISTGSKNAPFLIMQSNGGVVKHSTAGDRPVTMLLSGPAAGILGAMHMARLAGFKDILTSDVGGTSTDVSIIENNEPMYTSQANIEFYPVKAPMLDIITVGSGGGSIAWTDPYGDLKVGPHSAGSVPGPICYGNGGKEPTVTDAALVLGLLPSQLIGGEIQLNTEAARTAYTELGRKHNMSGEQIASGVLELAAVSQVFGIRQVTTTRGRDPSDYAMVAFGGAGGLFATDVADFLGIKVIISPPNPGNLCALGLHVSDVRRDYIKTLVRRESLANNTEIIFNWEKLAETGTQDVKAEGIDQVNIKLKYSADMRYLGEGHEVQVPVPTGYSVGEAVKYVWDEFHSVHNQIFGFDYRDEQDVELVNLRIQAIGEQYRPNIKVVSGNIPDANPVGKRFIFWKEIGCVETPIYSRAELRPEQKLLGPAIVEEYGSTTVVPGGWMFRGDKYNNLILNKNTEKG